MENIRFELSFKYFKNYLLVFKYFSKCFLKIKIHLRVFNRLNWPSFLQILLSL